MKQIKSKFPFLSATIGTMVEYYDFALFSTFLPLIAPLFFPADNAYKALSESYILVGVATLFRPLGAIFFGYFGDAKGRRVALLTSMYGIAYGTMAIGLIPTYASIGIAATIILIAAKTLQIFCFGGEYNGAGIYVVEHAQNRSEGLTSCWFLAITLSGGFFAALFGVLLTAKFMPSWGWRIAFIVGGVIGLIGIHYRKQLLEIPNFKPARGKSLQLSTLLKKFPKELLAGFFIGGFASTPFATVFYFVGPILMSKGAFTAQQFMVLQTILQFTAMVALFLIGTIIDKISPQKMMLTACLALIVLSYPLLYLIEHVGFWGIVLTLNGFIIINEMLLGPSNAYLKNLFPMEYRYRGSSLSFCAGLALIGGFTPLAENYFYQLTHHFTGVAIWLAFIGAGTIITMNLASARVTKRIFQAEAAI